jgi:chemotaxis protein CheX
MSITHEDLVRIIQIASSDVFTTMLALDPEPREAFVSTGASSTNNGVVSLIGLTGSWAGTGSISCTAPMACRLASQLMMSEYDAVDDDVLDAMAEVTNMIIGNVKTTLEETVGPLGLSIPTVIHGRNFTSRTPGKQTWTVVPFVTGGEIIEVQICLVPSKEGRPPALALNGQHFVEV